MTFRHYFSHEPGLSGILNNTSVGYDLSTLFHQGHLTGLGELRCDQPIEYTPEETALP